MLHPPIAPQISPTSACSLVRRGAPLAVDGLALNSPPITITPPAGPLPVHVVSSSAVVPATVATAPAGT